MKTKRFILFTSILVIFIIILVCIYLFIIKPKSEVKRIDELYSSNEIQNLIDENITEEKDNILELTEKINGIDIIGTLKIDKINFKGLVYEGTDLKTLKYGVGHFSSSPFINGNVCFAAHNTWNMWANLKDLKNGDTIEYTSFLGSKIYQVFNILQIEETDFSLLNDTNENIVTLITCVKNNRTKRLCVQAKEII